MIIIALAAVLTGNAAIACPGETLTYTCVTEGISQRWRILRPAQDDYIKIVEKVWRSSNSPQMSVLTESQFMFNFTLLSTQFSNFTSLLSMIASDLYRNLYVECSSPLQQSSDTVRIAGIIIDLTVTL